jgi:type IV pilus assembly protein PilW
VKKHPLIRSISGFTLIELLVAIAVSGIVLAGLVSIFTTANRSYSQQDEMATLQQNLRVAKMFLERDIRMAGCGMGVAFFIPGVQVFPIVNTNGGHTGSDALTITYVDYDDSCNGALSPLTPTAIALSTITVAEDLTNPATPLTPPYNLWTIGVPCSATSFFAVYSRAVNSITPANITKDVFSVSVTSAHTLQCSGLRTGISATIPLNSSINFFSAKQLVTATYSLAGTTLSRTLSYPLLTTQQLHDLQLSTGGAIADDIEDLQFAFGLDTNADGAVDSWINNDDPVPPDQIRQVRVSILGRSSRELPGQLPNSRPLIEDHTVGTVPERYLRQLLQFEIKPRNIKG